MDLCLCREITAIATALYAYSEESVLRPSCNKVGILQAVHIATLFPLQMSAEKSLCDEYVFILQVSRILILTAGLFFPTSEDY